MANVTFTIDDEVLRRARIRALEQGTSVNALVRAYLESLAAREAPREAVASFLEHVSREATSSGEGGRRWSRDGIYRDRDG